MTIPHSAGWYDDPNSSDAERYFDGQEWTPQRRRKEPTPKQSSQVYDPYGPPAYSGPHVPLSPAYDTNTSAPPYAYGPPRPGSFDPYGSIPTGCPQQSTPSGLRFEMVTGINRTLGVLIAASGLGLAIAAFLPWGKATQSVTDQVAVVSPTASFPGLGAPRMSATYSDGTATGNLNLNGPLFQFQNTNPGWIALALGMVAVLAGATYLWLPQRRIAAVAVAFLGTGVGSICVSHFFDVRGMIGNPLNLADANFSPGAGLVAACLLSFAAAGLGVWAYIVGADRGVTGRDLAQGTWR